MGKDLKVPWLDAKFYDFPLFPDLGKTTFFPDCPDCGNPVDGMTGMQVVTKIILTVHVQVKVLQTVVNSLPQVMTLEF